MEEIGELRAIRLGAFEQEFIAARDGFYMASTSETGWPYIQYRGGEKGFLHVLDDRTLGFADLRGNKQYISVETCSMTTAWRCSSWTIRTSTG